MIDDPIEDALALAQRLPEAAVIAIFRRYGKPFDDEVRPPGDRAVAIAGASLRAVRVRMPVDVIANDWFVLEEPGQEPLAVAGPLFAAALAALARAIDQK